MATYTDKTLSKLLASLHLVSNICYDSANLSCFALYLSVWEQTLQYINCFWLHSKFTTRTLFLTICTFLSLHYWTFTDISSFQHARTVWFSPNLPFSPKSFLMKHRRHVKRSFFFYDLGVHFLIFLKADGIYRLLALTIFFGKADM